MLSNHRSRLTSPRSRRWRLELGKGRGAALCALLVSSFPLGCGSGGAADGTNDGSSEAVPGRFAIAAPAISPGRQHLSGHVSPLMARAALIGRVARSNQLTVTVGLPLRDAEGLARAVAAVSDPLSPSYRQYLTPEEFANQFGATPADYQQVLDWARSRGLAVEAHPSRLLAHVTGTVSDLEAALHLQFNNGLRSDGSMFYGPSHEPSLDLDVPIAHISNLDSFHLPRRASSGGSGSGGLIFGQDHRRAYASCTSLTGAGQSIGILSLGGGFLASDISSYISLAGFTGVPAVTTIGPSGSSADIEDTLDIEMALSMAPGAHVIAFRGSLNQILGNMAAHPEVKQLTSSWFTGIDSTSRNLLAQFAMQGQTFFEASGDSGALNANSIGGVNDFRTQPTVTVVGGTDLAMVAPGASYYSETTWPGSSGGILSNTVNNTGVGTAIPSYQIGLANGANQASSAYRNIPDVAAVADGIEMYLSGGITSVGGTSAAAPLWAGFMALINQQAQSGNYATMGAVNPALYLLAQGGSYSTTFNDVTTGSNPTTLPGAFVSYNATSNYDLTTGLGTPKCGLITALSAPSNLSAAPSINQRGFGVLEIFGQQGGRVIHRTYNNGMGFGPWQAMPPVTATSAPASVSWATNRIDVVVKGASGEIEHAWWNAGGDWAGWENLGCCFDTAPSVSSWAANRLDIFAGSGGHLWHRFFDSGWGGWEDLGGTMTSAPSAVSWGSGRIDVFAKGSSNELSHKWYNNPSGWSGWENLGCCFDTAPGVSSWGVNRLDMFIGSGGSVWHRFFNAGWGGWENIGGAITSDLSATSWGVGRIDIMARGSANSLAHQWYNNGVGFGGWESL